MSYHPTIWSVKELAEITKKRVENNFDSNIAVTGGTGMSKCQPKGSKILMADGSWKNIEDVKKGDFVLSPQKDGSNIFAKVTRLSNWFCEDVYNVYDINKKLLYKCSNNHLIPILDNGWKNIEAERIKKAMSLKISEKAFKNKKLKKELININIKKSKEKCYVYGFTLDSPSKWYITDNWMVTHNSTFLFKFFSKFPDFKIEDKLTYDRTEMIRLIRDHKLSYCWADELISVGNKRKFYDAEQIELIEVLTKYRSNRNILGGAVPIFFTLDKELLKLFGMHINMIDRGIGVVHLPRTGRMFTDDIWDVKINAKLEEKWSAKLQRNPNFKIPYHKYTTFAGYVYFGKMTEKQEKYYNYLRDKKRGNADLTKDEKPKESFYEKVLRLLREKKLDEKGLFALCSYEGKKLSSVKVSLNRMLKDEGSSETLKDLLKDTNNNKKNNLLHNNTIIKELSSLEL